MKKIGFYLLTLLLAVCSCTPDIEGDGGDGGGNGDGTGTGGNGTGGGGTIVIQPGSDDYLPGTGDRKKAPTLYLNRKDKDEPQIMPGFYSISLQGIDSNFSHCHVQIRVGDQWKYLVPRSWGTQSYQNKIELDVMKTFLIDDRDLPKGQVDIRARALHTSYPGEPNYVGNYDNLLGTNWSELFTVVRSNVNGFGTSPDDGHEEQKQCDITLTLPELNLSLYTHYGVNIYDNGKQLISNEETKLVNNSYSVFLTGKTGDDHSIEVTIHRYKTENRETVIQSSATYTQTIRLVDDIISLPVYFKESDFK